MAPLSDILIGTKEATGIHDSILEVPKLALGFIHLNDFGFARMELNPGRIWSELFE
jgi:hypothetical protein